MNSTTGTSGRNNGSVDFLNDPLGVLDLLNTYDYTVNASHNTLTFNYTFRPNRKVRFEAGHRRQRDRRQPRRTAAGRCVHAPDLLVGNPQTGFFIQFHAAEKPVAQSAVAGGRYFARTAARSDRHAQPPAASSGKSRPETTPEDRFLACLQPADRRKEFQLGCPVRRQPHAHSHRRSNHLFHRRDPAARIRLYGTARSHALHVRQRRRIPQPERFAVDEQTVQGGSARRSEANWNTVIRRFRSS